MHLILNEPFKAMATTTKYQAVKATGNAQEKCDAGDAGLRVISVMTKGVTLAIAGGTINAGDELKVTATGALTPVTTAGDIICAKARDDAASGDLFNVEIRDDNKHA
jgi:hypothetical protein